ncbi:MAG: N-acetyltransferase family protein [Cyanobacteria bacterium J06621_8]
MNIRSAALEDLPAIVEIYNQSIPGRLATADTEPVTLADKLDWFHQRPPNRPLWVIEQQHRVAGWLSFQNFYGRPAYRHTAEISLYIATAYQHQGLGSRLLQQAIADATQLELKTLLAFIFDHNQPSLKLFANFGFVTWGNLPDVAELDCVARSLKILGLKIIQRQFDENLEKVKAEI